MPLLGLWYVNDFLDYQGWEQMTATVGIPFNGYQVRDNRQQTIQDNYDYNYN